ncbi:hypothetical protein ABBQ38_000049 [Trebouxia sp. C0009 RCD-2024]
MRTTSQSAHTTSPVVSARPTISDAPSDRDSQQQGLFPESGRFLCGVALSVFQNSGDDNAQWAHFQRNRFSWFSIRGKLTRQGLKEEDKLYTGAAQADTPATDHDIQDRVGKADIAEEGQQQDASKASEQSGDTIKRYKVQLRTSPTLVAEHPADFWNNYETDIQLAAGLGCNSFRISLEWSRVMPEQGVTDMAAVQRYHDIFDCIERCGMVPNVTLHWWTHPEWFDKLGEFTTEDCIPLFEEWAQTAFYHFGHRVHLWATFNEPEACSLCGHVLGNHPPGRMFQFKAAGQKLLNMVRCHAAAYRAIKQMPGGEQCAVGIILNTVWAEPRRTGALFKHVEVLSNVLSRVWDIQAAMNYLLSGRYTYTHPLGKLVSHVYWDDPQGKPGCDWLGVNHYARAVLDWNLSVSSKASKVVLTDMGFPVEPHSLYMAVAWASQLKVPMYIMESGAPFDSDENGRAEFINSALEQVKQAVNDGYDLRGYHYWTLLDDYEFNYGYDLKFGLYSWDPKGTGPQRTERPGAKVLRQWYSGLAPQMQQALRAHKNMHKTMPAGIRTKDCPTPTAQACTPVRHRAAIRHVSRQPYSSSKLCRGQVGVSGLRQAAFIA